MFRTVNKYFVITKSPHFHLSFPELMSHRATVLSFFLQLFAKFSSGDPLSIYLQVPTRQWVFSFMLSICPIKSHLLTLTSVGTGLERLVWLCAWIT